MRLYLTLAIVLAALAVSALGDEHPHSKKVQKSVRHLPLPLRRHRGGVITRSKFRQPLNPNHKLIKPVIPSKYRRQSRQSDLKPPPLPKKLVKRIPVSKVVEAQKKNKKVIATKPIPLKKVPAFKPPRPVQQPVRPSSSPLSNFIANFAKRFAKRPSTLYTVKKSPVLKPQSRRRVFKAPPGAPKVFFMRAEDIPGYQKFTLDDVISSEVESPAESRSDNVKESVITYVDAPKEEEKKVSDKEEIKKESS